MKYYALLYSFGLLAGLAPFFDMFIIPFIPKKYRTILYIFSNISLKRLMLLNTILPLFELFGILFTFYTLIAYISNKILLLLCTLLAISLQILFVDHFLPYHTHFDTEYHIAQDKNIIFLQRCNVIPFLNNLFSI